MAKYGLGVHCPGFIYQAEGKLDKGIGIFRPIETAVVQLLPTIGAAPFKVTLLLQLREVEEAV